MFIALLYNANADPEIISYTEDNYYSMKIHIAKNFTNYMVEEYEVMEFLLGNYFSGQLMNYQIEIINMNDTTVLENEVERSMITLINPYTQLYSQFISNDSVQKISEPFPRSTLLYRDKNGDTLFLYFVTRDYKFYKYQVSSYAEGLMKKIEEIQLDKDLLQGSCSDIQHVSTSSPYFTGVVIFCSTQILDLYGQEQTRYTTVFIEQLFMYNNTARYYSSKETFDSDPNFEIGFKYITQYTQDEKLDILYLFSGKMKEADGIINTILVNFTVFTDMYLNMETYRVGEPLWKILQTIQYKYFTSSKILDTLKIYDSTDYYLQAIALDEYGVAICKLPQFNKSKTYEEAILCNYDNTQYFDIGKILSLYKNEDNDDYFYAAIYNPPGIVEFDISDFDNIYIYKKLFAVDSQNIYGTGIISVNKNYVLHLMKNIVTDSYVIRFYCRNSTFYSIAKYDYILPLNSKLNYFQFPNYYYNQIIVRDERKLNVTSISDFMIILNATNTSLIKKYDKNTFLIRVVAENRYYSVSQHFNVTFVNENFTGITTTGTSLFETNNTIFYNCGDDYFEYVVSDYFNGPNYNLTIVPDNDCAYGSCYFSFENAFYSQLYDGYYNLTDCELNILFPPLSNENNIYDNGPQILICVDKETRTISSYDLVSDSALLSNAIEHPEIEYIYFGYDVQKRVIFTVAKSISQDVSDGKYEIHFFKVENQIVWINYTKTKISYSEEIFLFNYNFLIQKGALVETIYTVHYKFIFFGLEWDENEVIQYGDEILLMTDNYIPQKIEFSSDDILFLMTNDNRLITYQQMKKSLKNLNEKHFLRKLIGFDVFNGEYLVVYLDEQIVEVYQIQMMIYLTYKMKLPLYSQYSTYQFAYFQYNYISRSFFENFLTILMREPDSNKTVVLIYSLQETQHNCFVVAKDFSEFYDISDYANIMLSGNRDINTLGVMNDKKIVIFQVNYYNILKVTIDYKYTPKLLDKCKNMKIQPNNNGLLQDSTYEIAVIKLQALSLFEENSYEYPLQQLNLHIVTQNQGLVITQTDDQKDIRIAYSSEDNTPNDYNLILETYIEGYNMLFGSNCFFYDQNGQIVDCVKAVDDETATNLYRFYLEFVTSKRHVIASFTFGRLFFLFDDAGNLIVSKLPANYNTGLDLSKISNQPLETVTTLDKQEQFGCSDFQYMDYYPINKHFKNGSQVYLFFYQCKINDKKVLKVAQITVYDNKKENNGFNISVFDGQLEIHYSIFDIEVAGINIVNEEYIEIKLVISCSIFGSFSNILLIYDMGLIGSNQLIFFQDYILNSIKNLKDTFKISSLLEIPNSQLTIAVAEDLGAFIIDTISGNILAEFNIQKDDEFYKQKVRESGKLIVFSAVENWPYSFTLLTNFGIYEYYFGVDLQNRSLIISNYKEVLIPINKRIIRISFDEYKYEIAYNAYGFAFLVTKYTGRDTYDVYLGSYSFFSNKNSKLLKMIKVSENQDCISLNEDPYYESSPEDQLAVNFICNTQLFIIRICMRPHMIIDLSNYANQATQITEDGDFQPGALQFNDYNLGIAAYNNISGDIIHIRQIDIKVNYQFIPSDDTMPYLIYMLPMVSIIGFVMLIFFLTQRYCDHQMREEKDPSKKCKFLKKKSSSTLDAINISASIISSKGSSDLTNKSHQLNLQKMSMKKKRSNIRRSRHTIVDFGYIDYFDDDDSQLKETYNLFDQALGCNGKEQ